MFYNDFGRTFAQKLLKSCSGGPRRLWRSGSALGGSGGALGGPGRALGGFVLFFEVTSTHNFNINTQLQHQHTTSTSTHNFDINRQLRHQHTTSTSTHNFNINTQLQHQHWYALGTRDVCLFILEMTHVGLLPTCVFLKRRVLFLRRALGMNDASSLCT